MLVSKQMHTFWKPHNLSICFSNSGDPLVTAESKEFGQSVVQVGIASWTGGAPEDTNYPSVYTQVSSIQRFVRKAVCRRTGDFCEDFTAEQKNNFPDQSCVKLPLYEAIEEVPALPPTYMSRRP